VGGAEANVSVSMSLFGHDTAIISAVPDNAIGRATVSELRKHGVDVQGIKQRTGEMGLYFLTQGALHRPSEVLYQRSHSVFASLPASEYEWDALLKDAAWLHLSGITPAVSAEGTAAASAAVAAAKRLGVKISFDCNYRSRVWDRRAHEAPAILKALVANATVLFADSRDLALIFESPPAQTAADEKALRLKAFAAFPQLQWLTALQRKSEQVDSQELSGVLYTKEGEYQARSYRMASIVDRIGAGDAFAAGILHGHVRQYGEQQSLEFGVAAACLKHSIPGDVNLVTTDDVQQLLTGARIDVRR
jgi:2-dehydro-3-deoxygluconokinase